MFMLGFYKSLLLLIFLGVAFLPALQWQMKVSTRKPLLKLNMRCHLGGHWNPGRKPHPYMYLPKPFGEAHNFSLIYRPWRMVGTTPQNLTFRCPNVTVLEKDDSAIKRRHFFGYLTLNFWGEISFAPSSTLTWLRPSMELWKQEILNLESVYFSCSSC